MLRFDGGSMASLEVILTAFFIDLKYQSNITQPVIDTIQLNMKQIFIDMLNVLQVRTFKIFNRIIGHFKLFHLFNDIVNCHFIYFLIQIHLN